MTKTVVKNVGTYMAIYNLKPVNLVTNNIFQF